MKYLEKIRAIIEKAGQIAIAKQSQAKAQHKKDHTWVTEVDIFIECFLKKELKKVLDVGFIGEETSHENKEELYWVVDPIDGTRAYKQKLDDYAVMIALMKKDKVLMGAVYHPALNRLFYAEKDQGSYMFWSNKKTRLKVSQIKDLKQSFYAYGYRDECPEGLKQMQEYERKIVPKISNKLINFSSGLGICDVARGSVDFVTYDRVYLWDMAAPSLILEEAGGRITNFFGQKNLNDHACIASNKILHERIIKLLA